MTRRIPFLVHVFYGICFGIIIYSKWLTHVRYSSKLNPRGCLLENNLEKQHIGSKKERDLIIIGIVTSLKNLNTRVLAMYKTWAHRIPGKVIFFIDKGPDYVGGLPVISLDGLFSDDYPPRYLGLASLQYMYSKYGQSYEWFLRADDDIFINVSNLELFLENLNSSKPLYIGQPGMFKTHETSHLDVGPDTPFCMSGPGVILSWVAMASLDPRLSDCLKTSATSHEDTELGRCVYDIVGIHCTTSYQMSNLFYEIRNDFAIDSVHAALSSALTIHPLKNSSHVYLLQMLLQEQMLRKFRTKLTNTGNAVSRFSFQIDKTTTGDDTSVITSFISNDHSEWNFIQSRKYYSTQHPYQKPWSGLRFKGRKAGLDTAVRGTYKHTMSRRMVCYLHSQHAYQRLTPNYGLMHLLALKCNKSSHQLVLVQRKFDSPVVDESLESLNIPRRLKKHIYVLLVIQNQSELFLRFLRNLTSLSRTSRDGIHLCVVIQRDMQNDYTKVLEYTSRYSKTNGINIKVVVLGNDSEHHLGIHLCLQSVPVKGLILWTDPGVVFTTDFLNRLSLNTIENKQVYFPITFSAFNKKTICYKKKKCNTGLFGLEGDHGMWRHFGFGTMGIYKSDLLRVTSFDRSKNGLGHEGTELYNDFLQSDLHIFRAVDPGITFLNQEVNCAFKVTQNKTDACKMLNYMFFGSQKRLVEMYLDDKSTNDQLR